MRELSQQIDSHMVMLDEDNPTTATTSTIRDVTQLAIGFDLPITSEAPMTGPIVPDNPSA